MHDSGKVHLDVKAANIIVTVEADGSGTGKVADFGLACGEESKIISPAKAQQYNSNTCSYHQHIGTN